MAVANSVPADWKARLAASASFDSLALILFGLVIPFVFGSVLAVVVYLLRRKIDESASFAAMLSERPVSSIAQLWRGHRREFLLVAIISAGGSLAF